MGGVKAEGGAPINRAPPELLGIAGKVGARAAQGVPSNRNRRIFEGGTGALQGFDAIHGIATNDRYTACVGIRDRDRLVKHTGIGEEGNHLGLGGLQSGQTIASHPVNFINNDAAFKVDGADKGIFERLAIGIARVIKDGDPA